MQYSETSDFAAAGDNTDDRFTSYHVLGGIDLPVWRWLGAAAEVNYRRVGKALGQGGASKEFGEDDLGGVSVRIKLTFGR